MRTSPLKNIRKKIDKIDNQIVSLIKKRFKLVLKTLKYKTKTIDTKREKQILARINKKYKPALSIFKAMMTESKILQKRAKNK